MMKAYFKIISFFITVLITLFTLSPSRAFAQNQDEIDEAFDPFADYNEFDQKTEEEADINFLRNGRYLTLSFIGGYRGFIGGGFAQAYKGALDYGAEFSYFFDLQLATSLSYVTGDHRVNFTSYSDDALTLPAAIYSGTVNIQVIDFQMKYYFNTDNVTKGLADLNPYAFLGSGYYIRTYSLSENLPADPDRVVGFKAGGGIEIPMMKHRGYLGIQGLYRYVQFPDENKTKIDDGTGAKPIYPHLDGDIFEINFMLGLNF